MNTKQTTKKKVINPEALAEEIKWLRGVANGDRQCFQNLHERFKGLVFTTIYKVLNDHQDSEDTMQEVFAQIWQKAGMFVEKKGKPHTWITTMARNRAIDKLRSKQRRAKLRDSFQEESETMEQTKQIDAVTDVYQNERSEVIRSAVMELSLEQRQAIELAFFSGLTQNEVADQLGQPLGTVKARIRRGVTRLKEKVKRKL